MNNKLGKSGPLPTEPINFYTYAQEYGAQPLRLRNYQKQCLNHRNRLYKFKVHCHDPLKKIKYMKSREELNNYADTSS